MPTQKFELRLSRRTEEASEEPQIVWSSLPLSAETLLDDIGYRDIGAVALALPMKKDRADDGLDDEKVLAVRESLRRISWTQDRHFGLACYIEDRLTIQEAQKMADNEPAMWEDIELSSQDSPTTHACVALNSFLWEHIRVKTK